MSRALLIALVMLAAASPPAGGATVSVEDFDGYYLVVRGGPEADVLELDLGTEELVVAQRAAAPLTLTDETGICRRAGEREVRCTTQPDEALVYGGAGDDGITARGDFIPVEMAGGPGDDRVSSAGAPALLTGGEGSDRLSGSPVGDRLYGGAGDDDLRGRGGNDLLSGDDDAILLGTSREELGDGADRLDGGPGRDSASWAGRRASGVSADLARGRARTSTAVDRLVSIEGLVGTPRSDRLAGGAGPNSLRGGHGRDVLAGRGGDDRLDAGTDVLGGNARPDGHRDRIGCGSGNDLVADALGPRGELIPSSCERLTSREHLLGAQLRLGPIRAGRLGVDVFCEFVTTCRRRVSVLAEGRELGRTPLRVVRRSRTRIDVPLAPVAAGTPLLVKTTGRDGRSSYGLTYRVRARRARTAAR